MKHLIFSAAFVMSVVTAADLPASHESVADLGMKSWKISLIPLVGSQALDAASSYGMRELNPLLASSNGGFERKATAIKLGVTGALVGVEYLIVRKYPQSARVISKLNWTTGIVTTGFAVHNYAIK
ncbi:MAG: hypothetical protein ABSF22_09540 [Bryobacteraceae bacterium]|jgi:hypothetical protein